MYYAWVTIGRLVMARFLLFSVYLLLASILSLFFVVSFSLWLSCSLFVFFSILWIPRNISPHFCHVSFFLVFYFSCSHDAVCFSLYFSVFSILISCYCWRWCSLVASQYSIQVRPTIHLLRRLLSFSIYSPSLFSSCFLFWHGHSSIRTILQFSTPNSSNDFIELG